MSRRRVHLALMVAPYLVGITLLVVVPALVTFGIAFTDDDLVRAPNYVGASNFTALAHDDVFWISLRNSLVYAFVATPLRLAGALGMALLLHRRRRGNGAARTAAYLPSVVPDVAYALLWLWLFNPLYGPINLVLGSLHVPKPRWFSDPQPAMAVVIIMSLFQIGEGFLVLMATRQEVPEELYELAELEGSRTITTFRRVTLPIMAPTLALLFLRDMIFSFQATFVPALIVTKGGPAPYATTFLPLFIYDNGFEYLRFGYAAAATLVMFVVTAVIVAVQHRLVRRWRRAFIV
jgi:multiple sugar transport system permease protein